MNGFATAITGGFATLDPAIVLQPVEQARQGRLFDPHSFGDFFLGKFVSALGKMDERPPFPLAQPEGAQALVQLRAPGARGPEEKKAEFIDIRRSHAGELVSMLTSPIPAGCQPPPLRFEERPASQNY